VIVLSALYRGFIFLEEANIRQPASRLVLCRTSDIYFYIQYFKRLFEER
jgi:hypothetical protein